MFTLQTEKRDIFGNKLTESRDAGKLPIVVYGGKTESKSYFVSLAEFKKVYVQAGESSLITLKTPDGDKDVLVHDVAFHAVSNEPLHVDFYVVDKKKAVEVAIPIVFEGEAPAEKLGAAIIKVMHEIEVSALPQDLPHEIVVDISVLNGMDNQITIADLKLPKGVKAVAEPEEVVVSVTEAGEEVVEEEAPVDLSSIEVEEKGKKEEETSAE